MGSMRSQSSQRSTPGSERSTPVVFLHAFPLHGGMWFAQEQAIADLAPSYALHARGFGGRASAGPHMFEHMVDDLISQLDALKVEDAIICGLSMGGYLALRLMERAPERCSGLLLCGTHSLPDTDEQRLARAEAMRNVLTQGVPAFAKVFAEKALAAATLEHNPALVDEVTSLIGQASAADIAAGLLAITTRTDTSQVLPRISVPTCVVVGAADQVTPPEQVCAMAERIPGALVHAVPSAGHLVNLEQPQAFNVLLREHVERCLAQAQSTGEPVAAVGELVARQDAEVRA